MCGIFGYKGKENATKRVLEGLQRLAYRGYDSWGIAVNSNNKLFLMKKVGKIADININDIDLPKSNTAIGHTRWATCGKVNETNAHPHYSTNRSFVLAQNGIVENHKELKERLIKKGYSFKSETDTEVIVRLIEDKAKTTEFVTAVRDVFQELKGRNTIIILKNNSEIIAARNGSPLVIGLNDKDTYLSSDTLSFAPFVNKIIIIDNQQLVHIKNNIQVFDIKTGSLINHKIEDFNMQSDKVDKEGYDHFMVKEINESPFVIKQVIKQKGYKKLAESVKNAENVYIIGSGTAGVASAQIAYYLRKYGRIKAISLIGGDAKEYFNFFTENDLIIAPSQSGETADVLEVLEHAKSKKTKIASYVNMPGSAMTRMSDFKFMANAGPEICVMSTKIFTSQIAWGYLIAKAIEGKLEQGKNNLLSLANAMKDYLNNQESLKQIKSLAKELIDVKDIFLMGKSQNTQIMNEGMVKLIEGTYKHAHSIPAGDLKHYAITLMEKGVYVIVAVSNDEVRSSVLNAIEEVKARGAKAIGISSENNKAFDYLIKVPEIEEVSAIMNIIPLQLLSYYLAVELGNSLDTPKHIAKSVTVL